MGGAVFRALGGGMLFTLTKESGTAKLIGMCIIPVPEKHNSAGDF